MARQKKITKAQKEENEARTAFEKKCEAEGKVGVASPGAKPTMQKWLDRGDSIAVFRNEDLGHYDIGRTVFLPIAKSVEVKIGETRAPDHQDYGLGWRYLLKSVHVTMDDFAFYEGPWA